MIKTLLAPFRTLLFASLVAMVSGMPAAANAAGTGISTGWKVVSEADTFNFVDFPRSAKNLNSLAPTFGSISSTGSACEGGQSFFLVTGLSPSSNSTLHYNINGGPNQTVVVNADASGIGLFSIPAVLANDNLTLTVTSVVWNGTPAAVTTNNTAVIDVNANGAVGGTTSGSATVCSTPNSGTITLSGHTGTISHWESSPDNTFTSPIVINNTTATLNWSNLSATRYFRAVVVDDACPPVYSTATAIFVGGSVGGGTLAGSNGSCGGALSGTLVLSGHSGTIVRWESSLDNFVTAPTAIAHTTTTYDYLNVTQTTYYRAVVSDGSCEGYSSVAVVSLGGPVTAWNGTTWSDGAPDSSSAAVFEADYDLPGDITACSITVTNNSTVTIPAGYNVNLSGTITVEPGSSFILDNNASLFQPWDVVNTSPITVKRNSSALMRQDYTLWSSPVSGQGLLAFSPQTVINPVVRFYNYNTETNLYSSVSGINSAEFELGKGYLIRMPNNHPSTPTVWQGSFTGIPNNGDYYVTMENHGFGQSFNLVGNPYPSPIEMNSFVSENYMAITGTLYFWRKTNNAASPSYCQWNWGTFVSNGEAEVYDPYDIIRTGQGFFVEANFGETQLVFNNWMRYDDHGDQFFRAASVQKDRIWLNLTGAAGQFSQMAVVYVEGGNSAEVDKFDGRYINDGAIRLTSKIGSVEYGINGRAPFAAADVVPLSFTVATAGNYTIAIDHVDGLFSGDQAIYLKDNLLGVTYNIKASSYSFASEAGTFDNRFEIVYENALAVHQPHLTADTVVAYKQDGHFVVDAGQTQIGSVQAFDMRGRLVAERTDVNATSTTIDCGTESQVLILKVVSVNGESVNKKVVN